MSIKIVIFSIFSVILLWTASAYSGENKSDNGDIERIYQAGLIYYNEGRFDKAIEEWEKVYKESKDYQGIVRQLAEAYKYAGIESYGQNKQGEAIGFWEKALVLDPNNKEIKEYIGRARGEEKALAAISGDKGNLVISEEPFPFQPGEVRTLAIPVEGESNEKNPAAELKSLADSVRNLSARIDQLQNERDATVDKSSPKIAELSGFVAADAFSEPDNEQLSFELNQVEIDLLREYSDWAKLRADLDYIADDSGDYGVDVEQAYVMLRLGHAPEWWFTFGKFNAPIGLERPDAPDMVTISHSLVYQYGRPVNIFGLMVASTFSPGVHWLAYIVNGWDRDFDTNDKKTLGAALHFDLDENARIGISLISGNEQDTAGSSRRTVLDMDLSIDPLPLWKCEAEFNHGIETDVISDGGDAGWNGLYVLNNFKFSEQLSMAMRFDYLDDKEGILTGFRQELKSLAAAPACTILDDIIAMLELKYDFSDHAVFNDDDGSMNDSRFTAGFRITGMF
ncbi:MAG: outer membrane beta-barrel protein [Candidatus Zixiibacteriota bacterium]